MNRRESSGVSMEASVFFPELSGGLEHQNGADNHDVCIT